VAGLGFLVGLILPSFGNVSWWVYIVSPIIGLFAGMTIASQLYGEGHQAALARYQEASERWHKTYFCHRCGNQFLPDPAGAESRPSENGSTTSI
jgi:hypothetical protein